MGVDLGFEFNGNGKKIVEIIASKEEENNTSRADSGGQ